MKSSNKAPWDAMDELPFFSKWYGSNAPRRASFATAKRGNERGGKKAPRKHFIRPRRGREGREGCCLLGSLGVAWGVENVGEERGGGPPYIGTWRGHSC